MTAFDWQNDDSKTAFKTGSQLQKEQIQKLMASNAKIAGGNTPQEQRNRALGSMLGSALVGKAMAGDAGTAAGDILAAQEKPPETAAEWAKVQKDLFAAGLEDDGLSLTAKIKGLQETEKGFADTASSKAAKYAVTDGDRKRVGNNLVMRTGNDESALGTTLKPFLAEDADPYQKVQLSYVSGAVAEKSGGIQARLRELGYDVDENLVDEMILDELENSGAATPESGMLWWQEDGAIDRKAVLKSMANTEKAIMEKFTGKDKPVQPVEPQTSTKMEQAAQPARMEMAIQEVMAADMPQEEKIAKVKQLAAQQRMGGAPAPGATDLTKIKPDAGALSETLNKLGTNPHAVETESEIEVKTGSTVERQKKLLEGLKTGKFNASEPWVQKMIRELFPNK